MGVKWHYIYKTTILQGKLKDHYYIGKRDKTPIEQDPYTDGYYGSGTKIKSWLEKHEPIEGVNIKKDIIEFNKDKQTNDKRESYWVGDRWFTDPLCLNLKSGGGADCEYSEEAKQKISASQKGKKKKYPPWNKGQKTPEKTIEKLRISHTGKKQTEEQKAKKSISMKKIYETISEKKRREWLENISKGKYKRVVQLLPNDVVRHWDAASIAAGETGIHKSSISMCCKGKRPLAGGFKWMYECDYFEMINTAS